MSNNTNYWVDKNARAEKAMRHHEEMEKHYSNEIAKSVAMSKVYSGAIANILEPSLEPTVQLTSMDTVSAAFNYGGTGRTAILNFASYKEPGGMFLEGSRAQEECLCHESILFEVLSRIPDYYGWNKKNLNKALYLNRAIYSPDIVFTHDNITKNFDVITCAAPNASAYFKYFKDANEDEVLKELDSRIGFIRNICESRPEEINTLVLGAFGCGVFGCDPNVVSRLFLEHFKTSSVNTIIFAVLDQNSPNYKAFEAAMIDYALNI